MYILWDLGDWLFKVFKRVATAKKDFVLSLKCCLWKQSDLQMIYLDISPCQSFQSPKPSVLWHWKISASGFCLWVRAGPCACCRRVEGRQHPNGLLVAVTCTAWTSTQGQRRWNGRGTFLGETFEGIWKWYEGFQCSISMNLLYHLYKYSRLKVWDFCIVNFHIFCQELVWELPSWKVPVSMAHEQKEEEWRIRVSLFTVHRFMLLPVLAGLTCCVPCGLIKCVLLEGYHHEW